jgi:flagellar protein FliO/FliZ
MIAPEADPVSFVRVVLSFGFVMALLLGMATLIKTLGKRGFRLPGMIIKGTRLNIVESLPLDARRRLVIVRVDDNEHVLLLGLNQDIVITSGNHPNQPVSLGQGQI